MNLILISDPTILSDKHRSDSPEVVVVRRRRTVELPTVMWAYYGGLGEAVSPPRAFIWNPIVHPTKNAPRWKKFDGLPELPPLLSPRLLRSQKSQRHEARVAGRSDLPRPPILLLRLPPNKSVPKPKNLSRSLTVTQNPTVLAANQARNSQERPQSLPLTSFKPNPTIIHFRPSPNHGARVYFFSLGVRVTLDSLGWERTSSVSFTSPRGTSGRSRGWPKADLAQPRELGWNPLPLVGCTRCLLTRMARCELLSIRSIAMTSFYRQIWSCGTNDDAALGRITAEVPDPDKPGEFLDADALTATPHPIQALIDENFRAVRIAAGDSISAAISTAGDLRAWGHFRVRPFLT